MFFQIFEAQKMFGFWLKVYLFVPLLYFFRSKKKTDTYGYSLLIYSRAKVQAELVPAFVSVLGRRQTATKNSKFKKI